MNKLKIGVGGSSANPPHLGHKRVISALLDSRMFSTVIWIPSGVRDDKAGYIHSKHRTIMTGRTFNYAQFHEHPHTFFCINYDDIGVRNTPTIEWIEYYRKHYPGYMIVWYTGVDSVVPQEKYGGKCEIQAVWKQGEDLYRNYPFLIIPRDNGPYPHPRELGLPENFSILDGFFPDISSSRIRSMIKAQNRSFTKLVDEKVAGYIIEQRLYGWRRKRDDRLRKSKR